MYIFKLKNNNKGYSTATWAILITISIFMLCTMLDIVNLVATKNILTNRVSYLANIGTIQGGFLGGAPHGWKNVHGNADYVTMSEATSYFTNSLTYAFTKNPHVSLPSLVNVHEDGVVVGTVEYVPCFTKGFGMPTFDLSQSARFCGFWWYETEYV